MIERVHMFVSEALYEGSKPLLCQYCFEHPIHPLPLLGDKCTRGIAIGDLPIATSHTNHKEPISLPPGAGSPCNEDLGGRNTDAATESKRKDIMTTRDSQIGNLGKCGQTSCSM